MNNIFNLKRFVLLFKEQTSKNLKIFLMGSVLVFAILFALDIISVIAARNHHLEFKVRVDFYLFLFFPIAFILSGNWFSYLSKRAPETGNLLLPVSSFERILVAFIINVILLWAVYLLIVLSVEIILFQDFTILTYATQLLKHYTFYNVLFFFQSLFLIGSLIFKKAAIIKTGFSIFVFFIILQLIHSLSMSIAFYDVKNLSIGDVFSGGGSQIISPQIYEKILRYLIYLGFPLIWIASYFKIKEKQV